MHPDAQADAKAGAMLSIKVAVKLLDRLKQGHHEEVIAEAGRLIRQYPKVAGLHEILGTAHATAGNLQKAETCLRRALKLDPGQQSALFNLGGLYLNSGKHGQAVVAFRQFLKRDPDNGAALFHLGEALFYSDMTDKAIEPLRRAAELSSEHTEARFLLGQIFRDAGEDDLALAYFQSVLEIEPSHYEATFNIGNIHRDYRRNDEALAVYSSLRSGQPDHLPLLLNIHACHLQSMDLEAATDVNDRVLEIEPGNANGIYNASCLEFLAGRWKSGYALYEKRFEKDNPVTPLYSGREPGWDGKRVISGGRLVLHAEQGLGDSIMMMRFLSLIDHERETPVVLIQPALEALAAQSFPDIHFERIDRHRKGWKKDGEHGVAQCSLVSLPHVLRDRWQDIPSAQGYLLPPDDVVAVWRHWLEDGNTSPAIGLAWRGNPKNPYERHRCVDVEFLASHLPHGPRYVVLQKDMTDAEYDFLSSYRGLDIRVTALGDFCTTAALCANLDMVVTVDTSAAHLCGALGTPTAVLLPFSPDSRWGAAGRNSDWYNSVTLYRQTRTGDWAAPLAILAKNIEALGHSSLFG